MEVKRAAKKRSAAKSKAAVPVSGAQPSHAAVAFDLPIGNEDEAAPAAGPGLPAGPRLVEDDDVPMSLPSPAESIHDEDPWAWAWAWQGPQEACCCNIKICAKDEKASGG